MRNDRPIVTMRDLSKRFGEVQALDQVSLQIYPGRIVGLLGANGSGKSTLVRHLIGLYLPTAGSCTTFGLEAGKLGPNELGRIGYLHQEGELLDWMTVPQIIRYVAAYYDGWNKALEERYIEDFELPIRSKVGNLSPGQRQKLAILLAIGFEPELLILDEPAASMDPLARRKFLDLLLEIIQDPNRTVLISSHILSDVEKVIDHVLILDKGKVLRDCGFDALQEEFLRVRVSAVTGTLPERLPFPSVLGQERSAGQAVLTLQHVPQDQVYAMADEANCRVEVIPLSLEDYFRLIVGKKHVPGEQP